MKKMILSVLFALSSVVHAEQLTTFTDMADAISQGKKITLVMNIQECSSQKMPSTSLIGATQPDAFMIIDNNRITASMKHFTLDNPISRGKPTFEYLKYNINADGSVSIKSTMMDATNYQQIAIHQMDCTLNKGFKVFG
ncbi:VirK family protein [Legionella anisa]|uniref:VirK protein n=1 Tax=Legionella anisa TaxID=28082 RepID=A0AAX0WTY7_9GAMM|nr:VirK family protein [Legionella anisa]AWN74035.1 VirK protein [Legionella anisa]KTC67308.1 VirK protein [Legionella anisa]MBN5934022.1 VirK protein [Legionella anisa]MCW8425945.1 VirK family protein [Legionella anisa]MCW8448621.1 VirK family protein [Legionella anisa]